MSLGKGPPLDRCCIGSALSTGRRFKREPSRSIVKCDPGADFPWNSEAPSFERGRQPIPQSCPTERQWNNFSLSPASLPESCPTERLWDSFCAAASPAAPAEAGRSHPQQGSYRFRRDARGTMIAPQQIAPRDAHPSIVVPAPKSPSHNPVRTLRYHASHASQGSPLGRKLSATLFVADGLTRNIAVGSFEPSFRLSLAGRFRPQTRRCRALARVHRQRTKSPLESAGNSFPGRSSRRGKPRACHLWSSSRRNGGEITASPRNGFASRSAPRQSRCASTRSSRVTP
jgi:hypothetical protein